MIINLPLPAFVGRIVCACCSIAIASALVGCSPNDGYPKDWQPVATASADQCPDITGTFAIDDKPAYHMLGGHYENNPRVWSVMSLAGNPQVGLQVALYEVGSGAPYEQPIKHNRGSDYQCSDGWLELEWPAGSIPMRSEDDRVPADDLMNKTLSLAKNSAGDLVIRTNVSHWKGFPVWCGDGCKYIPIPFTRKTYYIWSRWLPVPIPTYRPPTANPEKYDIDAEAPADESPSGRLLRLLRSTAPLGIRVIDAKPEGDHWVVRVLGDNNTLIDFHQELLSSNAFEVIRLQPGDRRSNGERTMDVTLRVSPDKLARDTKAEGEQTRIQEGKARQDKEAQLIKLLLPSFPKDMVTTAYSLSAEGFLVEVRHKDEDAFYQLIVNAQSSGHFSEAKIKTQKYVDGYGRQVVDVLLKPMQR